LLITDCCGEDGHRFAPRSEASSRMTGTTGIFGLATSWKVISVLNWFQRILLFFLFSLFDLRIVQKSQ